MTGTERLDKRYFVLSREISSMRSGQLTIFFYFCPTWVRILHMSSSVHALIM